MARSELIEQTLGGVGVVTSLLGMTVLGRVAVAGALFLGLHLCVRAEACRCRKVHGRDARYGLWRGCQLPQEEPVQDESGVH
ncbi:MAG: hypothetical protein GXY68_03805 [Chloroflexi bacterium]|nr:hypothetical protein [Chloroflexota bacterium]